MLYAPITRSVLVLHIDLLGAATTHATSLAALAGLPTQREYSSLGCCLGWNLVSSIWCLAWEVRWTPEWPNLTQENCTSVVYRGRKELKLGGDMGIAS